MVTSERLLEERDRLVEAASAGARAAAALSAMRAWPASASASGPSAAVGVRGQVVAGQRAGELVAAEGLEVARRGEVQLLAIVLGQRVVGDLADERLDERVLAALR